MKTIFVSLLAISLLGGGPAQAGNSDAEIAGAIFGGIVGGIIIGKILKEDRRHEQRIIRREQYYNYDYDYDHRYIRDRGFGQTYRCTQFPHGWDRQSYYTRCERID